MYGSTGGAIIFVLFLYPINCVGDEDMEINYYDNPFASKRGNPQLDRVD